ncbi:lysophospholipid acyltransferase family protein [Sphingomonas aracearum]|uniref:1-acyl-sn-glycerol-3-phosphate acyltransferase n=1 Tax=Sphingomonas aracearum TaxID=2283317 RepID=A0A369VTV5_9SPHN|nr:lysophospholipid acyltransferase family protein [Sphingomonas aracearum]RDE04630.1 1-acyl-sn-glycerol-3-phosphate acyltransferase [Sphingomonas aracearum]
MNTARTFLFSVVFWGGSVPIVLGAPVAALFGTPALRRYVQGWLNFHAWSARRLLGIVTRVEGSPSAGPTLYAGKHQSLYETFEMARLLDAPAIVMKRELARIPVWGWAAQRYGMIAIDRTASGAALRGLMRDAQAVRAEGRSVMIFPEGTRVAPGEQPPVKPGLAGLYKALKLPLVPVAVDSGRVWPRHGPKRPGIVTLRFGEPLPPDLPRGEMEARVHAAINVLDR